MTTMTQSQIDAKRAALNHQLAELDEAEAELNGLSPEQRNAITLHDSVCRLDHSDQCGWMYEARQEVDDEVWNCPAHEDWLRRAEAVAKIIDIDTFVYAHEAARKIGRFAQS